MAVCIDKQAQGQKNMIMDRRMMLTESHNDNTLYKRLDTMNEIKEDSPIKEKMYNKNVVIP